MRGRFLTIVGVLLIVGLVTACSGREAGRTDQGESAAEPAVTETPQPAATATPTRTPVPPEAIFQTPVPEPVEQSALERIRAQGELRVGVLYNYPPLGFLADNGLVQGYEPALARQIAERWGVEVAFVQVTRQTRLPMLNDGEIDLIAAAMPHRRELEQLVEFSDTIYRSGYMVLVRSDSGLDAVTALTGRVGLVGAEAGAVVQERARAVSASPTLVSFDGVSEAVGALEGGEVSAVVALREQLILPAQSNSALTLLEGFLQEQPYAFAVRRGDTPLRDLINLTLQDIVAAGEIGQIFSQNFYGQPVDLFPAREGEPAYDFASFPAEIPTGPSIIERIRGGGALRVAGMDLAESPLLYDSQPIYDGFNRAVINEMARRWGVQVVELPDTEEQAGMDQLFSGEADLVVGIRPDRSLIGQVALSQPYYQRALRLIRLRDVSVSNVLDLNFRPVMVVEPEDISRALIEDNNPVPQITEAESFEEAFDTLLGRSIYAVVGDELALSLMMRADPQITMIDQRYRPKDYALALPLHDPDFLALVNFTLQDMVADGTLERLRQQYFGPYLPEGTELEEITLEVWPGSGSYLQIGR